MAPYLAGVNCLPKSFGKSFCNSVPKNEAFVKEFFVIETVLPNFSGLILAIKKISEVFQNLFLLFKRISQVMQNLPWQGKATIIVIITKRSTNTL